jgi:HNH endonuclease
MAISKLILDYIDRHITYDPISGNLIKGGRTFGYPTRASSNNYISLDLRLDSKYQGCTLHYITRGHQIAWYLYYHDWTDSHIDHIDGNGCNNKLDNLRLATPSQNIRNSKKMTGTTSQYKGVKKVNSKWRAYYAGADGKMVHLGYYFTEEEAARVRDAKVKEVFGKFPRLNFPE